MGQTKRTIVERMKEHTSCKNKNIQKSAIAEHLLQSDTNHWIELHNPQVLATERHYIPRLVREAIEITKYNTFNSKDGFKLSSMWNPLLGQLKYKNTASSKVSADTESVVCRDRLNTKNSGGVVINQDVGSSTADRSDGSEEEGR